VFTQTISRAKADVDALHEREENDPFRPNGVREEKVTGPLKSLQVLMGCPRN
jgi:hypothetical protein